jgi:hypothetical protein
MQFVADGPDVPEELLQAHEEGRVVFFCGAGISYPAGLPGFKGLVEQIYSITGTIRNSIEEEAFKQGQFDATLDLLERRIPGQRKTVREALAKALKPKLRRKGATDSHAALLRLARTRAGALRLVTTNFDRVFDTAARRTGQVFHAHTAPMLPIPKKSRWDGLVFLHGLLPKTADENALNRLVMTSGDFGLAYLTERWAARFVSELFRNYIVCFIGYSINDPVLRYMMDALAADRMLGESTLQAWAFGDCEVGQEARKTTEWEAKGVTPILYDVIPGSHDHSALHKTLQAWSETYRDGITGKERMVGLNALARPSASTKEDDFVGRMLWALSDKSGLPARQFADFNPAPPLEWLTEAFSQPRFKHSDLSRFGVPSKQEVDAKLQFNLVDRPTPYMLAPRMRLATGGTPNSDWDQVMFHLSRWLIRHLNDPQLILWLVGQGGRLHDRMEWLVDVRLNELAELERDGKVSELRDIRSHSPNAIPSPHMRTLWRVLLSGRVKSPWRETDLYRWQERFNQEGMTPLLRLELRNLLAPQLVLKKPFRWDQEVINPVNPKRVRDLMDWELALASDHVRSTFKESSSARWKKSLPTLLEDFEHLLSDALDLLHVMGEAEDRSDRSHWDLPSIAPHPQNRGFRDWTTLIELLRDAWKSEREINSTRAIRIAETWFDRSYPTFKRLALFAASQTETIAPKLWTSWLVSDDGWWLWTVDLKREVLRLLVLQGHQLTGKTATQLQQAILKGPPRDMFRENLEPERWRATADHSIWLRLAKLQSSGLALGKSASKRFTQLTQAYPQWRLSVNERDEFSHWMSGSGDADYENSIVVTVAPIKRRELADWLKLAPEVTRGFSQDTWSDVCRRHLLNSLYALDDLANEGLWPINRWNDALRAWIDARLVIRSWRYGAAIILNLPDHVLLELAHSLASWLEAVSKANITGEDNLFTLCQRLMDLELEPDTGVTQNGAPIDQPVTEAINHPIGMVAQILTNRWFKLELHDNSRLSPTFEQFFTALADTSIDRYRHGRVILSSNLIALFRVDRPWTERRLLPLLNWDQNPVEAKSAWEGFLWSPRLYQPLLTAFKTYFLQTARHYHELGEHKQQFAGLFTYAAIGPTDNYTTEEFQMALQALPVEGLEDSAQALSQALEGAADQREEYWENRIQPFWQQIWPKSRDLGTARIAESLIQMTLAAGSKFPAALKLVEAWLCPLEHPHYVVHCLAESKLSSRFPAAALQLLSTIISDQPWASEELGQCLASIIQADPTLGNDISYQQLREYLRRRR